MANHSAEELDLREVRIGRIVSDLHERQQRGESIDDEQILAANPDLADELRPHLAMLRQLCSDDGSITRLIRQGVLSPPTNPLYRATFGDYQIIDYIGHGGMGVVLKAFDERLRRIVAIKLLRRELADDRIAIARFLREARAAAALSHPNIVSVFAVGEHDGAQFMAMEYVEGSSLSSLIREHGPLSTERIRWLFRQLLKGLAAAHAAGLIHRDIKSANLLIAEGNSGPGDQRGDDAGILKIADFGLARITSAQTRLTIDKQSFGTPEFMSPEQARGDDDIDHRTDLYSAGVVLYEMLTGRVPFKADSPTALSHRIIHEDPPNPAKLRPGCDPMLSNLALRLMAKRPEDRFAAAEAALIALGRGERIRLPAQRRLRARQHVRLIIAFVAIAMTGWAVSKWRQTGPNQLPFAISAVQAKENRLEVQFGASPVWQKLHQFPDDVRVVDAAMPDVDGKGRTLAVACTLQPVGGRNLFAFDAAGTEKWGLDLSSKRRWPDCEGGGRWFGSRVLAADLDGMPGDEIVAITHDEAEYATRLSIIHPDTAEVRTDFWHMGQIGARDHEFVRSWLQPEYFAPGRPALVVYGLNNKLDGFEKLGPEDEAPRTPHDIVSVVMILDPRELLKHRETLGPPRAPRLGMAPAPIYAYAFLDASHTNRPTYLPGHAAPRAAPEPQDVLSMDVVPAAAPDGTGPWFHVLLGRDDGLDTGSLFVDRNLNCHHILPSPHSPLRKTQGEWEGYVRAHWKPIIQRGEYLKRP